MFAKFIRNKYEHNFDSSYKIKYYLFPYTIGISYYCMTSWVTIEYHQKYASSVYKHQIDEDSGDSKHRFLAFVTMNKLIVYKHTLS